MADKKESTIINLSMYRNDKLNHPIPAIGEHVPSPIVRELSPFSFSTPDDYASALSHYFNDPSFSKAVGHDSLSDSTFVITSGELIRKTPDETNEFKTRTIKSLVENGGTSGVRIFFTNEPTTTISNIDAKRIEQRAKQQKITPGEYHRTIKKLKNPRIKPLENQ